MRVFSQTFVEPVFCSELSTEQVWSCLRHSLAEKKVKTGLLENVLCSLC